MSEVRRRRDRAARRTSPTLLIFLTAWLAAGCGKPATVSPAQGPAGGSPSSLEIRELTIAAAADLRFALDELLQKFHEQHPTVKAKVTYGSSGNLFAQIENGAPFDIFLSADIQLPRQLAEHGNADASAVFPYALGHLVVWVPQSSPLDLDAQGIGVLVDERVTKVAIANPKHAPYGRAAEAALKQLGVYDAVRERLVLGENVAQTAQFVESGAADAGIIALSLARAPAMQDKGRYWPVPADAHPPLLQGGVILNRCHQRESAAMVQAFLTSEAGRSILERFGFASPQ